MSRVTRERKRARACVGTLPGMEALAPPGAQPTRADARQLVALGYYDAPPGVRYDAEAWERVSPADVAT